MKCHEATGPNATACASGMYSSSLVLHSRTSLLGVKLASDFDFQPLKIAVFVTEGM